MPAKQNPQISIVIPAKNEPAIVEVIEQITATFGGQGISSEVIVSADDQATYDLALKASARGIIATGGYGRAVVLGAREAEAEFVLVMDGDGQHDVDAAAQAVGLLFSEKCPAVVVVRNWKQAKKFQNLIRFLASIFLARLARKILSTKCPDPLSGCFVARKSDLAKLKPPSNKPGISWRPTLAIIALHPRELKWLEGNFNHRVGGKSKMKMSNGVSVLRQICSLAKSKRARD